MEVFESLKANLVGKNARIVLPEGEEPRNPTSNEAFG